MKHSVNRHTRNNDTVSQHMRPIQGPNLPKISSILPSHATAKGDIERLQGEIREYRENKLFPITEAWRVHRQLYLEAPTFLPIWKRHGGLHQGKSIT
jgi:hypothetical protein